MANNILQQVVTYNKSGLALLLNSCPFFKIANTKFKDFDNMRVNLGSSVDFTLPTRFTTTNSLVVSFQSVEQRVLRLTVDQEISTSYDFTDQERVFNLDGRGYMEEFGAGAVAEIASKIEANIAQVAETTPYRFFGDGVTPITSYLQLANALAFFRNFGAAQHDTCVVLPDLTYPAVINSGLNQFVTKRNEELAMSWEMGHWNKADWYQSNLLPTHTSGTEGTAGSTLTVVSVTKNADDAVTAITFSGTSGASDPDSIKENDSLRFNDGVSGQPNLRFRTFIGHEVSQSPVQMRATADAASTGGSQVTVTIDPPLKASSGRNQNINTEIVAGMQVSVLPSHRCGLIMSGKPLFIGMPRLPDVVPFPSSSAQDPETGISTRQYYGTLFGQNKQGMVHDAIWGRVLVPEYSMKLALPL